MPYATRIQGPVDLTGLPDRRGDRSPAGVPGIPGVRSPRGKRGAVNTTGIYSDSFPAMMDSANTST
ncbi:hypothetical protein K469DRAFT_715848 [Zopfia rhizophila CBS 207.26]|uniref:Uncharacterized protein n=1 Tax=Zopfia rhizophila CBS 207.26 TaxID=1314779 RepID=A0A6A6DKD9_9PEZI|nr:hypothetical protein K469DRAFT_715848 [Zopfia rhizophila CBS 207.26]